MVQVFPPSETASKRAHISSLAEYRELYDRSVADPEGFWAGEAERISWSRKWDRVRDCDYHTAKIAWFEGGKLNACYNCVDRHVEAGHGDATAIIWEGNDPDESRSFTYAELHAEVQRAANALKALGVGKGDRVCIYLQMVPELAIAMLACARIGAVHSIVFGAFSADSLVSRINDSACKLIITQDTGVRGTRSDIPMKVNADVAVTQTPSVEHILVVRRTGGAVAMEAGRDVWWHDALGAAGTECAPEAMDAEDPLFILYTSGSTGKPKGVLHTTGGYLVYVATTHHYIFDYHEGEVYWCTADIGWVTGHSYIIYGPLANRAMTLMFEGVPNFPDFGRFWRVVAKHRVNIFYTAPTALRALMKEGDTWPQQHDRSSLRLLGTVGEPIKEPEGMWYRETIGEGRCPIVDTWWQTETGGILITPLPGAISTKPGSATLPFFSIRPVLVDDDGNLLEGNDVGGNLCIAESWPGQMRTIYGDTERFFETYFARFPGIQRYIVNTMETVRECGYSQTLFGRKTWFPRINSKNQAERQGSERAAVNAPIQGTSADIIKRAMARMGPALAEAGLNPDAPDGVRMLLQVHDELVFELPKDMVDAAKPVIERVMAEAALPSVDLTVPLGVEIGTGPSWDAAH